MKKAFIIFMALTTLAITVSGCNSNNTKETQNPVQTMMDGTIKPLPTNTPVNEKIDYTAVLTAYKDSELKDCAGSIVYDFDKDGAAELVAVTDSSIDTYEVNGDGAVELVNSIKADKLSVRVREYSFGSFLSVASSVYKFDVKRWIVPKEDEYDFSAEYKSIDVAFTN